MERKDFLKTIGKATILGGLTVTGLSSLESCNKNNVRAGKCSLTGSDELGSYYLSGTTNMVNLNSQNLPGTPMIVKGTVYSGKGGERLANAKIEIWHADNAGAYHPNGSGDVSGYASGDVTLRGFVLTDENGNYSFQSIVPGLYEGRARHIHYRISAPGHIDLVTQSYFQGDPRIKEDALSKKAGDCRVISFLPDGNGNQVGHFIVNLKKK